MLRIKRHIFVLAFLSFIWPSFASASLSNYNFSFTGSGMTVTGTFLNVDSATNLIGGITGTVSGTGPSSGAITGLLPVGTVLNDNKLFPTSSPYLNSNGVGFYTGLNPNNPTYMFQMYSQDSSTYLFGDNNGVYGGTGTLIVTAATGAPEIDGKLLPQILLLLVGSTLLYRRNREQLVLKGSTSVH